MRLIVAAVAGCLLMAGLTSPATADVAPADVGQAAGLAVSARERADHSPQLRRRDRWLVDQHGRVVIVHGLNLVYKRPPYVPPATPEGFTVADASWLARHGFNGVRLGTLWAGLTPDAPGRADAGYLDRWQRVMDLLSARGIWMQLDVHQDQWHEQYGGEGVPDWAAVRPAPYNLLPPLVAPFPTGYWTPEVSTVFDRFWANRGRLLDGWVDAWRVAARRWSEQSHLMGYDLLNEPWAGMEWAGCLLNGCPAHYRNELQPAMEKALRAIREIDSGNIVWWEPQQFAGGQPLETYFEAVPGERQLGLSWHNYCYFTFLESQGIPLSQVEQCDGFSDERNRHAIDQAERMDAVPLMSEWGATDNLRAIEIDADVADRHLMGWLHWSYKFWNDPTTADTAQGLFHDDADLTSVKEGKLRLLVRTYAQATAGTPLEMSFDPGDGTFEYTYRPDPKITAPTEIFVSPLHYPAGYDVDVVNGAAGRTDGQKVYVRATSGGDVTVRVTPRMG